MFNTNTPLTVQGDENHELLEELSLSSADEIQDGSDMELPSLLPSLLPSFPLYGSDKEEDLEPPNTIQRQAQQVQSVSQQIEFAQPTDIERVKLYETITLENNYNN